MKQMDYFWSTAQIWGSQLSKVEKMLQIILALWGNLMTGPKIIFLQNSAVWKNNMKSRFIH